MRYRLGVLRGIYYLLHPGFPLRGYSLLRVSFALGLLALILPLSGCYHPHRVTLSLIDGTRDHHLEWAIAAIETGDTILVEFPPLSHHGEVEFEVSEPTLLSLRYGPEGGGRFLLVAPGESVRAILREDGVLVEGSPASVHLQHFIHQSEALRTRTMRRAERYLALGAYDSLRGAIIREQEADNLAYREGLMRFTRLHPASRVGLLLVEQHPFLDTPLFCPLRDSAFLWGVAANYLSYHPESPMAYGLQERLRRAQLSQRLTTSPSLYSPRDTVLPTLALSGAHLPGDSLPSIPSAVELRLLYVGKLPLPGSISRYVTPLSPSTLYSIPALHLSLLWIEPMDQCWRAWRVTPGGRQRLNDPQILDSLWRLTRQLQLQSMPSSYLFAPDGRLLLATSRLDSLCRALDSIPSAFQKSLPNAPNEREGERPVRVRRGEGSVVSFHSLQSGREAEYGR